MKPADLAIVLHEMFGQSMRAGDAMALLFEAIDRHDKFTTLPTAQELRTWLLWVNKATAARDNLHADINILMDDLEDGREVAL